MHRPEPQTRRGSSRPGPGSSQEPGPLRDRWLPQRQALHDAANWLTVLLGHVDALGDAPAGSAARARHLELARRAARAAHRLCALPPDPVRTRSTLDARRHALRLVEHLRGAAQARSVSVELVDGGAAIGVRADPAGFDDAVMNLLRNAVEAVPRGGSVRLCLETGPTGLVGVFVEDDGPGIPAGMRRSLGRPGLSTRSGDDRGLGLSRVRSWLEAVGTDLVVDESSAGGARIGFVLEAAGEDPGPSGSTGSGCRVLLVEDDLAVAEVLGLLLQADGHQVRHEGDLQGGREAFRAGAFDLVLCDQNLPDGSGEALVAEFAAAEPAPACFLVTGDPESVHSPSARTGGVLAKPVSRDDLRRAVAAVRGATDSPGPARSGDAPSA